MAVLTIDEDAWEELLDEAQASVDGWNARCVGYYAIYSHELRIRDLGNYVLAEAMQHDSRADFGPWQIRRLGWRKSDGALMKVTLKRRRNNIVGQLVTTQSWHKAAAKSMKHLLKVARFADFILIGKAYVSHTK
jgi:hypothetical protein